jgi:hypothetical protein
MTSATPKRPSQRHSALLQVVRASGESAHAHTSRLSGRHNDANDSDSTSTGTGTDTSSSSSSSSSSCSSRGRHHGKRASRRLSAGKRSSATAPRHVNVDVTHLLESARSRDQQRKTHHGHHGNEAKLRAVRDLVRQSLSLK